MFFYNKKLLSANSLRRRHSGFTLFEVLVAVIVMSIGLLGVGSLQLVSTRSNFEALQRTEATMLANAAIDRMRANSQALATYASGDIYTGVTASEANETCVDEDCNNRNMAKNDRKDLEALLIADAASLVNPRICISQVNALAQPGAVRVVVAWRSPAERGGNTALKPDDDPNDYLDSCGWTNSAADDLYLKQVVINTYITPFNPG